MAKNFEPKIVSVKWGNKDANETILKCLKILIKNGIQQLDSPKNNAV